MKQIICFISFSIQLKNAVDLVTMEIRQTENLTNHTKPIITKNSKGKGRDEKTHVLIEREDIINKFQELSNDRNYITSQELFTFIQPIIEPVDVDASIGIETLFCVPFLLSFSEYNENENDILINKKCFVRIFERLGIIQLKCQTKITIYVLAIALFLQLSIQNGMIGSEDILELLQSIETYRLKGKYSKEVSLGYFVSKTKHELCVNYNMYNIVDFVCIIEQSFGGRKEEYKVDGVETTKLIQQYLEETRSITQNDLIFWNQWADNQTNEPIDLTSVPKGYNLLFAKNNEFRQSYLFRKDYLTAPLIPQLKLSTLTHAELITMLKKKIILATFIQDYLEKTTTNSIEIMDYFKQKKDKCLVQLHKTAKQKGKLLKELQNNQSIDINDIHHDDSVVINNLNEQLTEIQEQINSLTTLKEQTAHEFFETKYVRLCSSIHTIYDQFKILNNDLASALRHKNDNLTLRQNALKLFLHQRDVTKMVRNTFMTYCDNDIYGLAPFSETYSTTHPTKKGDISKLIASIFKKIEERQHFEPFSPFQTEKFKEKELKKLKKLVEVSIELAMKKNDWDNSGFCSICDGIEIALKIFGKFNILVLLFSIFRILDHNHTASITIVQLRRFLVQSKIPSSTSAVSWHLQRIDAKNGEIHLKSFLKLGTFFSNIPQIEFSTSINTFVESLKKVRSEHSPNDFVLIRNALGLSGDPGRLMDYKTFYSQVNEDEIFSSEMIQLATILFKLLSLHDCVGRNHYANFLKNVQATRERIGYSRYHSDLSQSYSNSSRVLISLAAPTVEQQTTNEILFKTTTEFYTIIFNMISEKDVLLTPHGKRNGISVFRIAYFSMATNYPMSETHAAIIVRMNSSQDIKESERYMSCNSFLKYFIRRQQHLKTFDNDVDQSLMLFKAIDVDRSEWLTYSEVKSFYINVVNNYEENSRFVHSLFIYSCNKYYDDLKQLLNQNDQTAIQKNKELMNHTKELNFEGFMTFKTLLSAALLDSEERKLRELKKKSAKSSKKQLESEKTKEAPIKDKSKEQYSVSISKFFGWYFTVVKNENCLTKWIDVTTIKNEFKKFGIRGEKITKMIERECLYKDEKNNINLIVQLLRRLLKK